MVTPGRISALGRRAVEAADLTADEHRSGTSPGGRLEVSVFTHTHAGQRLAKIGFPPGGSLFLYFRIAQTGPYRQQESARP